MKTKFTTIQYKLILAFGASAVLSAVSMISAFIVAVIARYKELNKFSAWIGENIVMLFLLSIFAYVVIMSFYFILLTRRGVRYIDEITENIEKISHGNLEINIPLGTSDELEKLAASVNRMAYRIRQLLEEERSWERAKNDLVTSFSHDLRTPLTSILGYLKLISDVKYTDEEALKRYTDIAYSKCNDLKLLIDDLFEYSKLNSCELKVNKIRIDLGELIEQVIIGFIPVFRDAGMKYRLSLQDEKVFVNADPVLLARMLDNLIGNAVKYGKEGVYADIGLTEENDKAVVRIGSFGKTVPDEDLPNIFDKFYRVDKSRSRQEGGSGLGLAIVKSIVDRHQGEISVSSAEGKTVFEVRLPKEFCR